MAARGAERGDGTSATLAPGLSLARGHLTHQRRFRCSFGSGTRTPRGCSSLESDGQGTRSVQDGRGPFSGAQQRLTSGPRDQLRRELTRLCPVRPGCPHLPWAMRVRCRSQSPGNGVPLQQAQRRCARDLTLPSESLRVALIRHAAISRRWPEGSSADQEAALAASSSCRATADNGRTIYSIGISKRAMMPGSPPRELLGIGIASRHPCISVFGVGDDVREAPGTDREDLSGFFRGVAERV